jgi:D-alanyl-D-alanine dipeptidase
LFILDAYRPLSVQASLFNAHLEELVTGGMAREEAIIEAQRFVSLPSSDPARPSPHNTGGAVDLTIIRFPGTTWNPLEAPVPSTDDAWEIWCRQVHLVAEQLPMGTVFDAVQPETRTRYYEELTESLTPEQEECRDNRRMLYNVMAAAGFSNLFEEWWHFNSGIQMAAITCTPSATARYGAAEFTNGNQFYESQRRAWHRARCNRHGSPLLSAHPKAAVV